MKLGRIFLGKLSHWLIVLAVPAVLWIAGDARLHVRHFNVFLVLLGVLAFVAVALVVFGHKPGEMPMREPVEPAADSED